MCVGAKDGKTRTFRISRMRNTFVTSDHFETDEDAEARLKILAIRSPHTAAPDIHAVVRLTESGMRKYKLIVKNRPAVTKISGDLYHFDWPEMQLEDYFKRFGKDAVVVRPGSLKTKLKNYYAQALEAYE